MNITKNFTLSLLLVFLAGKALMAQSSTVSDQQFQMGPSGDPTRSICPTCPSLTCPMPSPTGGTGCTGPNCQCTSQTTATVCCLNIDNNFTNGGTLNLANQIVLGDLQVALNADIKDSLLVEERANFSNNVCIVGNKTVDLNVNIAGFEVVLGTVQVNTGGITASGPTVINGNDVINGSLTISGNQSVTGSLTVDGTGKFNGPLLVTGVSGTTGITGTGQVVVTNGSIISGGLIIVNPTGCASGCTGAIINGNLCINGDLISNNVIIENQLIVDQLATLNSVVTATGTIFTTNGSATLNDGLTITGNDIVNTGSKIIGGNLSVSSTAILESPAALNQGASISNGLVIQGGATVDNLAITSGSLLLSGTLGVNGFITSEGGVSTFSDLTITDTLNSSCPTGPAALVVLGGAGFGAAGTLGKDLWLGGSEYFANTLTEGGVPTSLDYYEENCFSTAFTWGGLTVSPPLSVMVRVVRVGNIVNLLVPSIIYNNAGLHIDVITSTTPIPERFRPFTTVRGASSTIVRNAMLGTGPTGPTGLTGSLGEYDVSPAGIITFGLAAMSSGPLGTASNGLGPQRIISQDIVEKDVDTITYNINSCERRCKLPCT